MTARVEWGQVFGDALTPEDEDSDNDAAENPVELPDTLLGRFFPDDDQDDDEVDDE